MGRDVGSLWPARWCGRTALVAGLVGLILGHTHDGWAQSADPDWPCIQRLTPALSAAQMWSGPDLDEVEGFWSTDPEIAPLVPDLVALDTPTSEARAAVETFARETEAGGERLALLFKGVLEAVNGERTRTIAGIKRYASRQRALADRIAAQNAALEGVRLDRPIEEQGDLAAVREQRDWDLRVFDTRQDLLTQICERPVMLDQRAFALARAIQEQLP